MNKSYRVTILLLTIVLAACSSTPPAPTVTPVDINALQTAAVETIVANLTQTAEAIPPTETPQPTETATLQPTEAPPTLAGSPTPITCANLEYISDVSVPDGTVMEPGKEFVKTWKVKNTGTCTWDSGYSILFAYGDGYSSQRVTPLTVTVQPDEMAEVSITLKAPTQPGTYSWYFRLQTNNEVPFGTNLSSVIIIQ